MTGAGHRFGKETIPKFAVGQPAHRTEDARFLTGSGRYTDDINLPGQVHGFVVRSPFAHARIRALSVAAARALINAILDALAELGINHIDMPATPERVWRLMRANPPPRPGRLDGEG